MKTAAISYERIEDCWSTALVDSRFVSWFNRDLLRRHNVTTAVQMKTISDQHQTQYDIIKCKMRQEAQEGGHQFYPGDWLDEDTCIRLRGDGFRVQQAAGKVGLEPTYTSISWDMPEMPQQAKGHSVWRTVRNKSAAIWRQFQKPQHVTKPQA